MTFTASRTARRWSSDPSKNVGSVSTEIAAAPASLTTVGGMNRVRWGVIGAGDVVEHKSGPALQRAQNSELVAVMRRDRHRAEDFARRHNVPRWYGSADELIHDPEVVLLDDQGEHHLERAPKEIIARQLIAHVARLYRAPKGRRP